MRLLGYKVEPLNIPAFHSIFDRGGTRRWLKPALDAGAERILE
jgi:hypothetical protein